MRNQKDNELVREENARFEICVLSVIGDREEQQDSFGYTLKDRELMAAVCDGMGGMRGGSMASSLAVDSLLAEYERAYPAPDPNQMLLAGIIESDRKVASLESEPGVPMNAGSTCVSVMIRDSSLYWCSAGDSRLCLLRGEEFVQITHDHNYKAVLREKLSAGTIAPEEYQQEMRRGEALVSYVGIGNLSLIDYNETAFPLEQGDLLVLMTDGLYRLVPEEEISRLLQNFSNLSEAAQALDRKAARAAKSDRIARDNMTYALIRIR